MVMAALDPSDETDMAERAWDRALVQAMEQALGSDAMEAAVAGFIEAWNETLWADMPDAVRASIMRDPEALVAETLAVNIGEQAASALDRIKAPVHLIGGAGSPKLAGRILDRMEQRLVDVQRTTLGRLGHMGPVLAAETVAEAIRP